MGKVNNGIKCDCHRGREPDYGLVCVCVLSHFSDFSSTLCDPMDCGPPGSSVHGFSRQEYWSGLPFPPPEDLPDPAIEPASPALQADSLLPEPSGKPHIIYDA